MALFLVPVAAIAAGSFEDVPDGHTFAADIAWMKDTGVTKGCNPPTNDRFCPDAKVTRGQVAAFIHRLAEGVVTAKHSLNADKLDGFHASNLMAVYGAAGGNIDDFQASPAESILGDTVYAPTPGYLHITATVNAADDYSLAGAAGLYLWLEVDGSVATATTVWLSDACGATNCNEESIALNAVVPVSTAGNHTLGLMAVEVRSGTYIHNTALSTLFTPFGDAAPLGAATMAATSEQPGM